MARRKAAGTAARDVPGSTHDQGSERFARLPREARRRLAPDARASDVARDVVMLPEQAHLAEHARDEALVGDLSRRHGWAW